ncbi:MAG: hypothetical protein PUE61_10715 [Clostridiales bacterium]|nr:hypothetical protein [Clostridiales bacterium]
MAFQAIPPLEGRALTHPPENLLWMLLSVSQSACAPVRQQENKKQETDASHPGKQKNGTVENECSPLPFFIFISPVENDFSFL